MNMTSTAMRETASASDWRLTIPEPRRRQLRVWLWSIAATTCGVLIVGGITRLTQSGLSIVDWQPLLGVIPPLNDAQWEAVFEQYRQYPEYQQRRQGMTLEQFRFIFFWEYVHRLLARFIGVVFLAPFIVFAVRGYFNRPLLARALLLFGLGAMQGVMGWVMVMSGLVDRPSVSHYRLAAHLGLAFVIVGFCVWLVRELSVTDAITRSSAAARRLLLRGLTIVGVLLCVQIVWGAFVAGLKAGHFYPTFPLMGGRIVPQDMLTAEPALLNFVANPVAVQWLHRLIGTALLIAVVTFAARVARMEDADVTSRRLNSALLLLVLTQYGLGILTLVLHVPIALGVAHQVAALIIFGLWLWWLHHARALHAVANGVLP
ncbi:MAG TPA: COX15/CtaA family protein [Longimicrobiales bacterium]|nr:COX15/CtaA family protein [Longimicrobiales bacterium]